MAQNQHESNDGDAATTVEDAPIPGSVFNQRQVRTLKIVVIVLGVLLVLGFAVLVAGLYHEATKLERAPGSPAAVLGDDGTPSGGKIMLDVPAGARIDRIAVDGGVVVLHIRAANDEQVVIVDTARGNAITQLRLAPKQ